VPAAAAAAEGVRSTDVAAVAAVPQIPWSVSTNQSL
jgi:hypothetical protein